MVEIQIYRIRIGLHYGRQKNKGIDFLNVFEILIAMPLLLTAGIERNPGPLSEDSNRSTASSSFLDNLNMKCKFFIGFNNTQSITKKVDLIESELGMFDIISLTETWLDHRTSNDDLNINGFNLYRRDRPGDNHGGICIYAKQKIYSRRRIDLELPNIVPLDRGIHAA